MGLGDVGEVDGVLPVHQHPPLLRRMDDVGAEGLAEGMKGVGRDWSPENGGRCEEGETVPHCPCSTPRMYSCHVSWGRFLVQRASVKASSLIGLRRSVAFAFTILHQPACQAGSQSVHFGVVNTPWASRCAAGLLPEVDSTHPQVLFEDGDVRGIPGSQSDGAGPRLFGGLRSRGWSA